MDFYVILGLGRDATTSDIKRAYRRLARRYHPGINPGDQAAERLFRQISEAYETLSDPARRRQYDEAGGAEDTGGVPRAFEFSGFDFSFAAHGADAATFSELFAEVLHPPALPAAGRPEPGSDLHSTLTIGFEESIRGVERQVMVTRHVTCSACEGAGRVRTAEASCPHCEGTGKVQWARGHMVFAKTCVACGGTGRERFQPCLVCAGHGRAARTDGVAVQVPAGITDGSRLRVPEKGHAGRWGGRPGDLYVDVRVQSHALLQRVGDDLLMSVPVAVHEAALGARIEVPSLDGPLSVKVPAGTQGGQRLRLSGRGAPNRAGGRGDLILEVRLVLPKLVDERSKELMREFGRINNEDVRRDVQV